MAITSAVEWLLDSEKALDDVVVRVTEYNKEFSDYQTVWFAGPKQHIFEANING